MGRAARPYPPADLLLNGQAYPDMIGADLVFTWKHRDRVLQADTLVSADAASIGPEPGTTYTVQLWNSDKTILVAESAGVVGTTTTIQIEDVNSPLVVARVFSVRDGLESLMAHEWEIEIPITPLDFVFTGDPYTPPAGNDVDFIFES